MIISKHKLYFLSIFKSSDFVQKLLFFITYFFSIFFKNDQSIWKWGKFYKIVLTSSVYRLHFLNFFQIQPYFNTLAGYDAQYYYQSPNTYQYFETQDATTSGAPVTEPINLSWLVSAAAIQNIPIKDRVKGFFTKSKLKEEDKNALEFDNRTEDGMKRILNNGIHIGSHQFLIILYIFYSLTSQWHRQTRPIMCYHGRQVNFKNRVANSLIFNKTKIENLKKVELVKQHC